MAVFVRLFRLAMLFFNIYDSYKVLRLPPPSSRSSGKPSLRALSQRKRDMKGSLAVWIVWCCFIVYERFGETLVSLFIPFYDEFKSLVMLFLIMTRARGAEPIYLHIIRPFLKPYTTTVDQVLDFIRVVGDIVLGLIALPFIRIIEWWNRKSGSEPEALGTEAENPPISSQTESQPRLRHATSHLPQPAKQPVNQSAKDAKRLNGKPSQRNNTKKVFTDNRLSRRPNQHEIWHPPPSAYQDEGYIPEIKVTNQQEMQFQDDHATASDGWRQYPKFPSAYPPTPLLDQNRIITAATISVIENLYPSLPDDVSQQGFRQSLLPPHNSLNPSSAGDLSDYDVHSGVQPREVQELTASISEVDDEDESMEVDGYESEDAFNVTLRTPDSLRITTSSLRPLSTASSDRISPLSLPGISSTAATMDYSHTQSTVHSTAPSNPSFGQKRQSQYTSSTNMPYRRPSRTAKSMTRVDATRKPRSPVKHTGTIIRRRLSPSFRIVPNPSKLDKLDSLDEDTSQTSPKRRRITLNPPKAVSVTQANRQRPVRLISPVKSVQPRVVLNQRALPRSRGLSTRKVMALSSGSSNTASSRSSVDKGGDARRSDLDA